MCGTPVLFCVSQHFSLVFTVAKFDQIYLNVDVLGFIPTSKCYRFMFFAKFIKTPIIISLNVFPEFSYLT